MMRKRPASGAAAAEEAAAGKVRRRPAAAGGGEEEVSLTFPKWFAPPEQFLWGTATAAYQVEGAASEGGRSPSIWDSFSSTPGKVRNGDTGAIACDHYHRWKEDVDMVKQLGLQAYRFSISWSRLLPLGRGQPNKEAVEFYGAILDRLRGHGIEPVVTLYHWDLPQCLEDEYGGWLDRRSVKDFEHYAAVAFREFGSRVKWWLTFNEPWCSTALGYATGEHAPGHTSAPGTEPYIAGHHILLAHAAAVQRYRKTFQKQQRGKIGLTLNTDWRERLTDTEEDREAEQRCKDWQLGWFADPIWKGDYPGGMRSFLGDRLPTFTEEEKGLLRGSADFFGLNHYSTSFVGAAKPSGRPSYFEDVRMEEVRDPRWVETDMGWPIVPWGLCRLCLYLQRTYAPTGGIIIFENGCAVAGEDDVQVAGDDVGRVQFYQQYLAQLHAAIEGGADVRGYFAWSLLDNFEWSHGYSKRFGLVHVDYETQLRSPKASAAFFGEVARSGKLTLPASLLAASEFRPMPEQQQPQSRRASSAL